MPSLKQMRKAKPPDVVRIQFSVAIRQRKGTKIPRELLEMAVQRWMMGESLPRGIIIRAVVWSNPDRSRPTDRDWRGAGAKEDIRVLLRGKPFRHVHERVEDARESLASVSLASEISFTMGRTQ